MSNSTDKNRFIYISSLQELINNREIAGGSYPRHPHHTLHMARLREYIHRPDCDVRKDLDG